MFILVSPKKSAAAASTLMRLVKKNIITSIIALAGVNFNIFQQNGGGSCACAAAATATAATRQSAASSNYKLNNYEKSRRGQGSRGLQQHNYDHPPGEIMELQVAAGPLQGHNLQATRAGAAPGMKNENNYERKQHATTSSSSTRTSSGATNSGPTISSGVLDEEQISLAEISFAPRTATSRSSTFPGEVGHDQHTTTSTLRELDHDDQVDRLRLAVEEMAREMAAVKRSHEQNVEQLHQELQAVREHKKHDKEQLEDHVGHHQGPRAVEDFSLLEVVVAPDAPEGRATTGATSRTSEEEQLRRIVQAGALNEMTTQQHLAMTLGGLREDFTFALVFLCVGYVGIVVGTLLPVKMIFRPRKFPTQEDLDAIRRTEGGDRLVEGVVVEDCFFLPWGFMRQGTLSSLAQVQSSAEGLLWTSFLIMYAMALLLSRYTFTLHTAWCFWRSEERDDLDLDSVTSQSFPEIALRVVFLVVPAWLLILTAAVPSLSFFMDDAAGDHLAEEDQDGMTEEEMMVSLRKQNRISNMMLIRENQEGDLELLDEEPNKTMTKTNSTPGVVSRAAVGAVAAPATKQDVEVEKEQQKLAQMNKQSTASAGSTTPGRNKKLSAASQRHELVKRLLGMHSRFYAKRLRTIHGLAAIFGMGLLLLFETIQLFAGEQVQPSYAFGLFGWNATGTEWVKPKDEDAGHQQADADNHDVSGPSRDWSQDPYGFAHPEGARDFQREHDRCAKDRWVTQHTWRPLLAVRVLLVLLGWVFAFLFCLTQFFLGRRGKKTSDPHTDTVESSEVLVPRAKKLELFLPKVSFVCEVLAIYVVFFLPVARAIQTLREPLPVPYVPAEATAYREDWVLSDAVEAFYLENRARQSAPRNEDNCGTYWGSIALWGKCTDYGARASDWWWDHAG
ncbi:unnamed protein product [Amoebophrya sp. A120]|nr:unnamed protein product [Amoebophrya sp. A120]|eukprot:GSA120T00006928001.1